MKQKGSSRQRGLVKGSAGPALRVEYAYNDDQTQTYKIAKEQKIRFRINCP